MTTQADRRWPDEMTMLAVIHVYEPWIGNATIPPTERDLAAYRVWDCRDRLTRPLETLPFAVLALTGIGSGA